MTTLGSVAKECGVSPTAVRKWLERANLDRTCWRELLGRYDIPDDVKAQIVAHYKGANQGRTDGANFARLSGANQFGVRDEKAGNAEEVIRLLEERVKSLEESNGQMLALLERSMKATDAAQARLAEVLALQAADRGLIGDGSAARQRVGAQESPPIRPGGFVRDFVSRLAGWQK